MGTDRIDVDHNRAIKFVSRANCSCFITYGGRDSLGLFFFRKVQVENPRIKEATDANQGAVGYATNGVAIFGPYNSGCCDATFNEIQSMDYCLGHPANGNYHYHYFSKATSAYDGCLMSCQHDVASNIVGVMLDGFPLYGPMQYFSPSEGKIYLNPGLGSRYPMKNHFRV